MTLLLAGCGSSDDSSGPAPCNIILAVATGGLSCVFELALTGGPPNNTPSPTAAPPPDSAPAPFRFTVVVDVEPNDSISTASVATFPTRASPEQRVGFRVNGTINNLTDGIDTYAFTSALSRTLRFELCASGDSCFYTGRLDVGIASLRILDQFGNILWSSERDTVTGNFHEMQIDAGVLYYVMVLAEDIMNEDQDYLLNVVETIVESEPEVAQDPKTAPPVLALPTPPPVGLLVTLDWIPPTVNVDGTPLLDLAGYNVYFGPETGVYLDFRHLGNPGLVTYVLDLPSSGSWFIVITALDSAGNESDLSNEIVVSVICECDLPPPEH